MDQNMVVTEDDILAVPSRAFETDKFLEDASDFSSVYSNEPEVAMDNDEEEEGSINQTLEEISQRLLKFGLDKNGLPLQDDLFFPSYEAAANFVSYPQASQAVHVVLWDYFAGKSCLDCNCSANDQVTLIAEEFQVRKLEGERSPQRTYFRLPRRWSLVKWVSNKTLQPIIGLIPSCWIVSQSFFEENYRLFCRSTWYIGIAEVAAAYELMLDDRNSHRAGRFVIFSPCWLNINPKDPRPFILLLMCQKPASVVNKIIELADIKDKSKKLKSRSVGPVVVTNDIPVPGKTPAPVRQPAGMDSRKMSVMQKKCSVRISMREGLDPELVAEHVSTPFYLKSYTIRRNHIGRYLLFDKQYETLFDLVHHLSIVPSALPHRLQQGPQNFSELFFDSVPQPFPNPKRDIYSLAMKSEKIASENYSHEVNPFFLSQAFAIINRALLLRPKLVPGNYPAVSLSAISYDEKGLLGTGEFGAVYKGKLNMQRDLMVDVAVKVLKRINRNSKNYDSWVSEMEVLQMVSHPNLIRFYGFCYDEKAEKVLLAFELMKVGSLMSYLKSKQFEVSVNEYIDFLLQISCGMDYLHSLDPPIIHGDLAARNVLMTYSPIDQTRFVLKISDFGLSKITRPQYASGEQWSEHIPLESEKLPFKWLPPEVLHRRELNPMSDVWSYGITVCEIYGVVDPYGMVASEKVLPYCNDGYRMEKPDGMPAYVFDVVLKCWRFQPVDRPSFEEIQLLLEPFYIEMEEVHIAVVTKRLEELDKIKPRM